MGAAWIAMENFGFVKFFSCKQVHGKTPARRLRAGDPRALPANRNFISFFWCCRKMTCDLLKSSEECP